MSYYIYFDDPPDRHRPSRLAVRYHWHNLPAQRVRWSVTEYNDPMYGNAQMAAHQSPEAEWFDGENWQPIADGYWEAIRAKMAEMGRRR